MDIPGIEIIAIISAFILGIISKYLDDLKDWKKAIIAVIIATVPAAIASYTIPEMYLATIVGVFIMGKIDTKVLSFYFLYLVLVMLVVDYFYDIKIKLLPLIIFTLAAALDEKEIRILGVERLFLPLSALLFMIVGLILEFFDIYLPTFDPQSLFNVGFKAFVYLLAFDIGYRITAWLLEEA